MPTENTHSYTHTLTQQQLLFQEIKPFDEKNSELKALSSHRVEKEIGNQGRSEICESFQDRKMMV